MSEKHWDQGWVWKDFLPTGWRVSLRLSNGYCHTTAIVYATKEAALEAASSEAKEIVDFTEVHPPTNTPPPAVDAALEQREAEIEEAVRKQADAIAAGKPHDSVTIPEHLPTLYPDKQ